MYCNWPQLTLQLIVNKASLFTFYYWTYDCDINLLKNYLEVHDIKAMCSLTMRLVPAGLCGQQEWWVTGFIWDPNFGNGISERTIFWNDANAKNFIWTGHNKYSVHKHLFWKFFGGHLSFLWGKMIPMFWTSGDVSPGTPQEYQMWQYERFWNGSFNGGLWEFFLLISSVSKN